MSDKGHDAKDAELGLPYQNNTPAVLEREQGRPYKSLRIEIAAFLGEFIGTFMFLSLAFSGTQIALNAADSRELTANDGPVPDVGKLLYIAFAFGTSLAINVAIFADVSGGKFNPAVSQPIALYTIGAPNSFRMYYTQLCTMTCCTRAV